MKKNIKFNIFITIIIICFFVSIFVLNIFSNTVLPIFMDYTVSKMRNISTTLINNTISSELANLKSIDEMIIVTKGSDDEIQMIDFNSAIVNSVLTSVTDNLLSSLKKVETDTALFDSDSHKYSNGIVYEVPLGIVSNNIFLSNLGPKIPVKLNMIGDIFTNINTEIKEYGINNALVKISIDVSLNEKIIIPFISKTVNVSVSVPISLKLIQGNIPIYYGNGFSKNSNILSTPIE